MKKDTKIEDLLSKQEWQQERRALRSIILSCGLEEEVKWGKLCYSYQGENAVIIFGLKDYCAIGFFKGALFADGANILVAPGANSQAMRQIRFTSLDEISKSEELIKSYIAKAVQAAQDGLEVDFSAKNNLAYPDELKEALERDDAFAKAFADLTPGRQRGYVIHFADAKQAKTRAARVAKSKAKIMDGKGLNER